MAKVQPNPEDLVTDIEDDDDDADDGDDSSNFDTILEKILSGGAKKGANGGDSDMAALLAIQERREARIAAREEKREARKEKQFMMQLLVSMMAPKGPDPLLMQLIASLTDNKRGEEFTRSLLTMQQSSAQAQMESMKEALKSSMQLKDEITKDAMEQMRENVERNNAQPENPGLAIMREIRLMAEPIISAKLGAKPADAPAQVEKNPEKRAITAPGEPEVKERIPFVLRALKHAQETEAQMTPNQIRSMRTKIAVVLMDVPDMATLICDEDMEKVFELCKPYVIADAEILNWIQKPGIEVWMNEYIAKLAIVLDAMMEAEEPAQDDPADGDADANNPPSDKA